MRTIAFPEISTGKCGFPKELARPIDVKAIDDFVEEFPESLEELLLVMH